MRERSEGKALKERGLGRKKGIGEVTLHWRIYLEGGWVSATMWNLVLNLFPFFSYILLLKNFTLASGKTSQVKSLNTNIDFEVGFTAENLFQS